MSKWAYAVDMSFDSLSLDEANLLKLAGVKVIVQCLWTAAQQPPPRVDNLRVAEQAGFTEPGYAIGGYASINASQPGDWHMDQAISGVPQDLFAKLTKISVDVELRGIKVADIRKAINHIYDIGKPRDIYSSYNVWMNYLDVRNPQEFSDCGLWNALWDKNPDFDFPTLRFGGWSDEQVWGEQWSGGTNVQGVFVDRNQFRDDAWGLNVPDAPPTPTPPPLPTDAQYLHSIETWAQITEQFALRNHLLEGTDLQDKAKFLLGL